MPTAAEVDEFQAALDDVKTVMVATLVAQWMESVQGNPAEALDELREFVLDLVAEYGQAAAAVAIDFYEAARPSGAPVFSPLPAVRADLLSGRSLDWAIQPLTTENWESALDRLAGLGQLATQQAAVDTIGESTTLDPLDVKFARYPTNDDPCAYCVIRASRGAIYWTEETATRGDHRQCMCKVTMVFSDEVLPYRRAPYMAQYQNGASDPVFQAASATLRANTSLSPAERRDAEFRALLAAMRRTNGLR